MTDLEKQYAEIFFKRLKEKWVYKESELYDFVSQESKKLSLSPIQEKKHLISFMEEMKIIRRFSYPDKVHIYITLDSLQFNSFSDAMDHRKAEAEKRSKMLKLDIDRAEWDIWIAKWGWLLGILAGLISGFLSAFIF